GGVIWVKETGSFSPPLFHRRRALPFLGKFCVFGLAGQAMFKFFVKEMLPKSREKVKPYCLSFGYFFLAKQIKGTDQKVRSFFIHFSDNKHNHQLIQHLIQFIDFKVHSPHPVLTAEATYH
ncbi:hypothetical protein ACEE49_11195, partial [[Pasteurella] aerogenes]